MRWWWLTAWAIAFCLVMTVVSVAKGRHAWQLWLLVALAFSIVTIYLKNGW